ncbi:MAG TPA: hypothetical protein VKD65_10935 [Candidatus Angelobacter sp.]|nr:hypothetical protein [Candidatus Angelobacter sp.]
MPKHLIIKKNGLWLLAIGYWQRQTPLKPGRRQQALGNRQQENPRAKPVNHEGHEEGIRQQATEKPNEQAIHEAVR